MPRAEIFAENGLSKHQGHDDGETSEGTSERQYSRLAKQAYTRSGLGVGFTDLLFDDEEEYFDANDGNTWTVQSSKTWHKKHLFPKPIRRVCGSIVDDELFQLGIVLLIAINAIMLGIGTFDFVEKNPRLDFIFESFDFILLIVFTLELGMQFIYREIRIFKSGWLVFDFFSIVFSWCFNELQVIRAFRVFRALRLISRIDTMRKLVEALLLVLPKILCIGTLLCLVIYVFGVLFTNLFRFSYRDGYTSSDYFSTLDATLFTLFQIMTMDSWAEICKECMNQYIWAWCPFVVYVVTSGFVVVNLIIAVICDSISSLQSFVEPEKDGGVEFKHTLTVDRKSQLQRQIDDLTVMLEQMQASQHVFMSTLERLTIQLGESGVVKLERNKI